MIKNETLKKILPSSIRKWNLDRRFWTIVSYIFQKRNGKPEYSTFQAFLIKSFDDSNDDYWKNWKELFNTSMMKKEFLKSILTKWLN